MLTARGCSPGRAPSSGRRAPNSTAVPGARSSKSTPISAPRWKKYSCPASSRMKPKPRSGTSRSTRPCGMSGVLHGICQAGSHLARAQSMTDDTFDEESDALEGRDHVHTSQPGHADTGTAAGVGGVTGAAIGSLAGPLGAAVGAAGGMIVGALTERAMHVDDDARTETSETQTNTNAE